MFWMMAAFAAQPLPVVHVMADGNRGLEYSYGLLPEVWATIEHTPAAPRFVFAVDGRRVGEVPIRSQVGRGTLYERPQTYRDSRLTVDIVDPGGIFAGIMLQGCEGVCPVQLTGPTRPEPPPPPTVTRQTFTMPSPAPRPAPAPRPQVTTSSNVQVDVRPEDVVQLATGVLDLVNDQLQQPPPQAPIAPPSQPVAPIALDPHHPVVQACSRFDRQKVARCVSTYAHRPHAASELDACSAFDNDGLREECRTHMRKSSLPVDGIARACQAVFGTDTPGMRCMNIGVEAETPPERDIVACGEGFEDEKGRLRCMGRFRSIAWDPTPVIQACKTAFPDHHVACLAHASSPHPYNPGVVEACATGDLEAEDALDCMAMMRRRKGDAADVVAACFEVFSSPKERFKCLEESRPPRVDAPKIRGCSAADKPLKCVAR